MTFDDGLPLVGQHQLFTKQQCDEIKRIADTWPKSEARVYHGSDLTPVKSDRRQGTVALIKTNKDDQHSKYWSSSLYHLMIIKCLAEYLRTHNIRVDVDDVSYQYGIYDTQGDWFKLHADSPVNTSGHQNSIERPTRKVSMTIELDDPQSYEGCKLYFQRHDDQLTRFDKKQGSAFIFPSYVHHEVSPLTSGVRRSMVAWFHGPWWI